MDTAHPVGWWHPSVSGWLSPTRASVCTRAPDPLVTLPFFYVVHTGHFPAALAVLFHRGALTILALFTAPSPSQIPGERLGICRLNPLLVHLPTQPVRLQSPAGLLTRAEQLEVSVPNSSCPLPQEGARLPLGREAWAPLSPSSAFQSLVLGSSSVLPVT